MHFSQFCNKIVKIQIGSHGILWKSRALEGGTAEGRLPNEHIARTSARGLGKVPSPFLLAPVLIAATPTLVAGRQAQGKTRAALIGTSVYFGNLYPGRHILIFKYKQKYFFGWKKNSKAPIQQLPGGRFGGPRPL